MIGVNDHSYSPSSSISSSSRADTSILVDEGNLSYINNAVPIWLAGGGGKNDLYGPAPVKKIWHHSTCCEVTEVNSSKGCCGCLDRGGWYVAKHALCAPFSFGTVANIASSGEHGRCVCGVGLCLGTVVGFAVCGGAVLPCAVKVRRKAVERYNIGEGYGSSVVHVLCCPGAGKCVVERKGLMRRRCIN